MIHGKRTTKRPTTSGYYWYKSTQLEGTVVVEVEWDFTKMTAKVFMPGNAHSRPLASMVGEWAPVSTMPAEMTPFQKWVEQTPNWTATTKKETFNAGLNWCENE